MTENIGTAGIHHVEEVGKINRELIEKALYMRCRSFLAQVQANLLTETIYEFDKSKKNLSQAHAHLKEVRNELEIKVSERTSHLTDEIRKRKEIEKELRAQSAKKSEFLSTAAHEFRTPLTSICGYSEVLTSRKVDDRETTQSYARKIHEEALYLTRIIEDLLDLSHIQSLSFSKANSQRINLNDFMNDEIAYWKELKPRYQFILENMAGSIDWDTHTDAMQKILKNIYGNAVEYSEEGSKIITQIERAGDKVRVTILDEGVGMTGEQVS